MKIDRLLGIAFYLMNHSTVSANALAERFEVSKRTVQRDVDALCMAGIPVVSTYGAQGGYAIMDGFRLNKQAISEQDYTNIVTALQALCTAHNSRDIDATLDKVLACPRQGTDRSVVFDFGAAREDPRVNDSIETIHRAIAKKTQIIFSYTDANDRTTDKAVEPLALLYRWYAWYLFGYCTAKKGYRMYKLLRVSDPVVTDAPFSAEHGDVAALLEVALAQDDRVYWDIRLRCRASARTRVMEYLGGTVTEEMDNGDFILALHLPESEHMWFSMLMGMGSDVTVLQPPELKARLQQRARDILSAYAE